MKKIVISIFLLITTFAVVNAQNPTPMPVPVPTPMPVPASEGAGATASPAVVQHIEFVQFKEISFDFGNIKVANPASHVFEFKNVGNIDINLQNVNASCGCTTPNWKGGIYKPGETGQITATFNAASEGGFNKSVTVTTSEGSIILTISGTVMSAAAYDEWKAKKDADDALKAKEDAAKNKIKGKAKAKPAKDKPAKAKPAVSTGKPKALKTGS